MDNKLFIMQGAPGCGKSTFIRKHNLDDYVISPDDLRQIINPNPLVYDENTGHMVKGYDFSPRTSKLAFRMANDIMSARMRMGQTIILDLTAANRKTISKLLQTAHDYNYHIMYVNMQEGLDVNEILRRNKSRGIRAIPDNIVRRMYDNVNAYRYDKNETLITKSEMLDMMWIPVQNMDKYDRIVCIGDIQGVWDRFKKTELVNGLRDDTLYVLTGDIEDRGTGAAEMFDWIRLNHDKDNLILIRGNHDNYWRYYGKPEFYGFFGKATRETIDDIYHRSSIAGDWKHIHRETRMIEHEFMNIAIIEWHGNRFVFTHGGILPDMLHDAYDETRNAFKLGFNSREDFNYGSGMTIGSGDYNTDIDAIIERTETNRHIIQAHGHRNEYHHAPDAFTRTFNLEQGVEYPDGHLAMLIIDGTGINAHLIS